MKQISIIVPIFCAEKYLNRCLKSIFSQTIKDFILILVDDGSIDSSGLICDEYANFCDTVIVLHQINQGQAQARNMGLDCFFEFTDSNWIMFVDSDDWIDSACLEQLYLAAKKNNKRISMCSYKEVFDYTCFNHKDSYNFKIIGAEEIYCEKHILSVVPWAKLYKRECFQNVRYPVGKICEDEFVTYKILFQCSNIVYTDSPFYYYFYNEEGVSKNVWSPKKLDSLDALRNKIVFFQDNGYVRAYNKSIIDAAMNISKNYIQINETECIIGKEKYKKILSSELKSIFRYKGAKRILPFTQYQYLYEIAYPKLMKYYWCMKSIKSKIIRIIKYQLLVLLF